MSPFFPPLFVQPGFGDMPVGAVIAFAGAAVDAAAASPPTRGGVDSLGWMACDGRLLNAHLYPELFAVLGHLYGGTDGQFALPDYRGYFLRGVDDGAGRDGDAGQRTDPAGGADLDQGVGSLQRDALQTHDHLYRSAPAPATASPSGTAAGAPAGQLALTEGGPTSSLTAPGAVNVSQTETRPKNVYVHYLIKFTYGLRPQQPFHRHHRKESS
jgi:microcystin-dependent protein